MTISKDRLDELLKGCERYEYPLGDAGLMTELKIRLMERMLGGDERALDRNLATPTEAAAGDEIRRIAHHNE